MTHALVFMFLNGFSYVLALMRGPFWALLAYVNVYFNAPRPYINPWAKYLPFHNWSMLTAVILVISLVLHRKELSHHKLRTFNWAVLFFVLSLIISLSLAADRSNALKHTYSLFTYLVIFYCIVRSITNAKQYRFFCLAIIILAGNLGVNSLLYGKRINARLENVGPVDAFGSNEWALLLASIVPLTLPFLVKGGKYERIICILFLPFLINAFILCNSRGAFVAVVGAVLVCLVIFPDWRIQKIVLLSSIVVVPAFIHLTDEYFITRLSTLLSTEQAMQDQAHARNLSSGRTEIWAYGLQMAKDHPLGAGPNAFKKLARFYMPDEVLTYHPGAKYGVRSAHNSYLEVLVEQGYLGFAIWLLMCSHTLFLLFVSFRKLKKMNLHDSFWSYSLFALGVSFVAILLGSLFNSRIYYEFFWWQMALAVVATSFARNMVDGDKEDVRVELENTSSKFLK